MSWWHRHIWYVVNVDKWAHGQQGRPITSVHLVCDCGATKDSDHDGDLNAGEVNFIAEKKGWRGRVTTKEPKR